MENFILDLINTRIIKEEYTTWLQILMIQRTIEKISNTILKGTTNLEYETNDIEIMQKYINMLLNLLNGIYQDMITNEINKDTKINIYFINSDNLYFEKVEEI